MREPTYTGAVLVSDERTIVFDCNLRESSTYDADVTEHAVEDGSAVSDHVRARPLELVVEAVATTTPVQSPDEPDSERDRRLRAELTEAWAAGELFDLVLEIGVFADVVIKRVSESVDASTGQAYRPVIELRQVVVAERETVELPPLPPDRRRLARPEDQGQQTPETPTPDDADAEAARGSILYDAVGGEAGAGALSDALADPLSFLRSVR